MTNIIVAHTRHSERRSSGRRKWRNILFSIPLLAAPAVNQCGPTPTCDSDTCVAQQCVGPVTDRAAQCTGTTCDAYAACLAANGCDETDVRSCYCGTIAFNVCFGVTTAATLPNGPCKAETTALAQTDVPIAVGRAFFDPTNPLGASNQVVLCRNSSCNPPVCQ
jgi:hypothetical protein